MFQIDFKLLIYFFFAFSTGKDEDGVCRAWTFMCCLKLARWACPLLQTVQIYGFSPVWVLKWIKSLKKG